MRTIKKDGTQMVLLVLSKLGTDYSVFKEKLFKDMDDAQSWTPLKTL